MHAPPETAKPPALCTQCEEPIKQTWWVPCCSKRCRMLAVVVWEGGTRYSGRPERVYMYAKVCGMCAREQGDPVYITHHTAALMERAGLARCTACRGWVLMDCLEMGSLGSPQQAVPVRSHAVGGTRSDGRKTL